MEVKIVENKDKILVRIECPQETIQVRQLRDHILLFSDRIWAADGENQVQVPLTDVLYFEAVDNKTIIVNLRHVTFLKPELNRSILATVTGGDHIVISRRYAKALLQKLSI